MSPFFPLVSAVGFAVSVYAFYVRRKLLRDSSYKPSCDISDHISCSKAFGSRYSKTMGIPNALAGGLYYVAMFILFFFEPLRKYLVYLTLPAVAFSLYLAYISYFRQRNLCLVCTFTYLINIALTLTATIP